MKRAAAKNGVPGREGGWGCIKRAPGKGWSNDELAEWVDRKAKEGGWEGERSDSERKMSKIPGEVENSLESAVYIFSSTDLDDDAAAGENSGTGIGRACILNNLAPISRRVSLLLSPFI